MQEAAVALGLQLRVLNAGTSRDIDEAFATFAHVRPDALFVTGIGWDSSVCQWGVGNTKGKSSYSRLGKFFAFSII